MNAKSRPLIAEALETAVDILRLRKGPEDMPASTALLWMFVIAGVLLRLGAQAMPSAQTYGNGPVLIALDLGITLAGVKIALAMAGHPARFTQTVTALLACQVLILPALLVAQWLQGAYEGMPGVRAMAQLLAAVVAIWLVVVTVRILRSATGWPLLAAVMLVLSLELFTAAIVFTLYPPPPEALAPPG